jgi:hypothetical protein
MSAVHSCWHAFHNFLLDHGRLDPLTDLRATSAQLLTEEVSPVAPIVFNSAQEDREFCARMRAARWPTAWTQSRDRTGSHAYLLYALSSRVKSVAAAAVEDLSAVPAKVLEEGWVSHAVLLLLIQNSALGRLAATPLFPPLMRLLLAQAHCTRAAQSLLTTNVASLVERRHHGLAAGLVCRATQERAGGGGAGRWPLPHSLALLRRFLRQSACSTGTPDNEGNDAQRQVLAALAALKEDYP